MQFEYFTLENIIKLGIIKLRDNLNINDIDYIIYDPILDKDNDGEINANNKKNYCDIRIIRAMNHDGTLIFTYELLGITYLPLINMTVNDKRMEDKIPKKYIIGKCKLQTRKINKINEHGILMTIEQITSIPVKFIY